MSYSYQDSERTVKVTMGILVCICATYNIVLTSLVTFWYCLNLKHCAEQSLIAQIKSYWLSFYAESFKFSVRLVNSFCRQPAKKWGMLCSATQHISRLFQDYYLKIYQKFWKLKNIEPTTFWFLVRYSNHWATKTQTAEICTDLYMCDIHTAISQQVLPWLAE